MIGVADRDDPTGQLVEGAAAGLTLCRQDDIPGGDAAAKPVANSGAALGQQQHAAAEGQLRQLVCGVMGGDNTLKDGAHRLDQRWRQIQPGDGRVQRPLSDDASGVQ